MLRTSLAERRRPYEHDEELVVVGLARPDLGAVQQPAAVGTRCRGTDIGEITTRVGFGHADREEDLSRNHAGNELAPNLLGPVLEERRSTLAIAHPVGGDGGAVGEQFFNDDESVELTASVTSVFLRPRQAKESSRPEFF